MQRFVLANASPSALVSQISTRDLILLAAGDKALHPDSQILGLN